MSSHETGVLSTLQGAQWPATPWIWRERKFRIARCNSLYMGRQAGGDGQQADGLRGRNGWVMGGKPVDYGAATKRVRFKSEFGRSPVEMAPLPL